MSSTLIGSIVPATIVREAADVEPGGRWRRLWRGGRSVTITMTTAVSTAVSTSMTSSWDQG